jgi:hypothetical protein
MSNSKTWRFPFGEVVRPVVQQDRRAKSVFVLGVYASAVHARWPGAGWQDPDHGDALCFPLAATPLTR